MPSPTAHQKKISHWFKLAGAMVLALGWSIAAVVYFTVQEPAVPERADDSLATLDSKMGNRAIQEQQGNTGVLMLKFEDAMGRPGPLALVIGASATVAALVCFRIAVWFSSAPEAKDTGQMSG
jgi:hypothetical protein